jgi:Flp pilus assembly pilin Flp
MRFFKDESGATAIEYGLIAALSAVAIIIGLNILQKVKSAQPQTQIEKSKK